MATKSELLIELISKKFFFPEYTFLSVKFQGTNGEEELCDCLLEFKDYYLCIQIKEKLQDGEISNYKWFQNKIMKRAVAQSKKSYQNMLNASINFYTNHNDIKIPVIIKENKKIIPLILFCDADFPDYNRCYYSKTIDKSINILSINDFKIMLDTIVLPYDIVNYLQERHIYMQPKGESRLIFDDIDDNITMMARVECEKDYADLFLARYYYNKQIEPGYIEFYNEFLNNIHKQNTQMNELIELLISADAEMASIIVKRYCLLLENINLSNIEFPLCLKSGEHIVMLIKKPLGVNEEFDITLENMLVYFAYKNHAKTAYSLIFRSIDKDKFAIDVGCGSYNLPNYDEELEKFVEYIESTLINNH